MWKALPLLLLACLVLQGCQEKEPREVSKKPPVKQESSKEAKKLDALEKDVTTFTYKYFLAVSESKRLNELRERDPERAGKAILDGLKKNLYLVAPGYKVILNGEKEPAGKHIVIHIDRLDQEVLQDQAICSTKEDQIVLYVGSNSYKGSSAAFIVYSADTLSGRMLIYSENSGEPLKMKCKDGKGGLDQQDESFEGFAQGDEFA